MNKVEIISFEDRYTADFGQLNFAWLEKYFYIEEYDKKVLNDPRTYILNLGGHIELARIGEDIVGTVALIAREAGTFELSKMAVSEGYLGKRIGQKLMYACIHFAAALGADRLFLDSNTILTPAITLYKKVGFKEIPVPEDSPYERCNIRMELML